MVEHDPEVMAAADEILDLGPGAGEHGGKLVAHGNYEEIRANPQSLTGRYLSGDLQIQVPQQRRMPGKQLLRLRDARGHNLKDVDVTIPLGMLVAVTGVSGSGKSTLVHDVLYQRLAAIKRQTTGALSEASSARVGGRAVARRGATGGPVAHRTHATLQSGDLHQGVRSDSRVFASLPESKKHGYTAGYFSFNIPGGRCETCSGDGTVTVEMQFLADVELICEDCKGTRYKPEILAVRYHGQEHS